MGADELIRLCETVEFINYMLIKIIRIAPVILQSQWSGQIDNHGNIQIFLQVHHRLPLLKQCGITAGFPDSSVQIFGLKTEWVGRRRAEFFPQVFLPESRYNSLPDYVSFAKSPDSNSPPAQEMGKEQIFGCDQRQMCTM